MLNDFFEKYPEQKHIGSNSRAVAASATLINAGEPAGAVLGTKYAAPLATNKPVVLTDYMYGFATTTSTNTASADGLVFFTPLNKNTVWVGTADDATAVNTQAKYDALVGKRVLIKLSAGKYTLLVADGDTNGLVIEPSDIVDYPGKIAFTVRSAVAYNN